MDRSIVEYYDSLASYLLKANDNDRYAKRLSSDDGPVACTITSKQQLTEYLYWKRTCAGIKRALDEEVDDEVSRAVVERCRRIDRYKAPSNVAAFHASLLWFFKVYFGRDMRLVDFWQGCARQKNSTDCGVYVAAYAYMRLICRERYHRIVSLVDQGHISAFRRFMTAFSAHAFRRQ